MDIQTVLLIARLRRTFSRQPDVLNACCELERLDRQVADLETRGQDASPAAECAGAGRASASMTKPKRDRAAYMRDYRRRNHG
ncbi:N6-adenosine-specific RNA methylase IME4 [Bradyrhizobium japonicum]|jgi:hypothetical protein